MVEEQNSNTGDEGYLGNQRWMSRVHLDSRIQSCGSSGCCCCLYGCDRHYGTGVSTWVGECPGWACHQAVSGKSEVEL